MCFGAGKMIRNVFFVMSLSGSIIAATWYVTYKLFSLELKSKWLRNLLLMSIPFYFIPLPLFKYYMHDLFSFLGLAPTSLIGDIEGSVDKEYMVVNLQSEFLFSLLEKTLRLSMLIIALISFLCIFFRICQYAYLWHLAKQCDPLPLTTPEASLMEALKCELNIAKEVTLIQSPNFTAPFTIGIKHPVVALPTELPQTKQALPMVLKHELIHIKHNDAVSNLIACIILAIHWFNPACYLFLHCFKEAHEIYCDEEVTCSMTKDEKYEYCNLILELSKRSERKWNFFMLSFIGSAKRQIRRRIKRIMKLKDCKFKMAVALGCIDRKSVV